MCNKSHNIGVHQTGEPLCGMVLENAFKKKSFMLNVHEQELVKWTTGDDGTKHFSGAAAWNLSKEGAPGEFQVSPLSDG